MGIVKDLIAGMTYTFSVKYMADATTDFDGINNVYGVNTIQQRIFARQIIGMTGTGTGGVYFADNHPEAQTTGVPINGTAVTYGVWNTATISWTQATTMLQTRIRLSLQLGDAYDIQGTPGSGSYYNGGGYADSMSFTETPEPATVAVLGLGALLLRRRTA